MSIFITSQSRFALMRQQWSHSPALNAEWQLLNAASCVMSANVKAVGICGSMLVMKPWSTQRFIQGLFHPWTRALIQWANVPIAEEKMMGRYLTFSLFMLIVSFCWPATTYFSGQTRDCDWTRVECVRKNRFATKCYTGASFSNLNIPCWFFMFYHFSLFYCSLLCFPRIPEL